MGARRTLLVLALCFLLLVSCGGPALITTPAKDMNLTADQLGSGYTLTEEEGLEALTSSLNITDTLDASDASYRMFQSGAGDVVLSMVITLKKPATEQSLKEMTGGMEQGFTQSAQGITLQEFTAPSIGDEATLRGVELADLGLSFYFLGFRKANVLGVLGVVGTKDSASQESIAALGQKLEAKIK